MRKLLKLWKLYAWMDLTWVAQDPLTFLGYLSSDIVLNLTMVIATLLLAERFDGIGTWSQDQVVFMLGYSIFVRGLLDGFFGFNVAFISRRIGRGQLDHVLVQPQPF
ncbi:MAG TPA: ABC-2 family transporter protein, partial [Chloroflexota bacterium]|nr:ABC-2 family transporter protein [Chloroflexota bacterium]